MKRNTVHSRRVLVFNASLTLMVLAFPGAKAFAAEPAPASATATEAAPAPPPRPEGRELGGHVFMPALGIVMPFATTSFGTFLTMGYGSSTGSLTLQLPGSPPPPPQTFRGTVSYAAIGGAVGFEYAFLRDVSARVIVSETLYSGTTGAAAALVGTNARLGGDVGLTAGLPIGNSVRVAGVFDASYAPRTGLVLGRAIRSAFDSCATGVASCRFDFGQLIQQRNVLTLEPGVAASWAPLAALGVTGNVTYSHASIQTSGSGTVSEGAVSIGTAVDFDFLAVSRVPVGLQATWVSHLPFSPGSDLGYTDLGGGLFYTGRKNLSLGLQVTDRRFGVAPDVEVSWKTFIAFIGLRYYW